MRITLGKFISDSITEFEEAVTRYATEQDGRELLFDNAKLLTARMFYQIPTLEEVARWVEVLEKSVYDIRLLDNVFPPRDINSYQDKIGALIDMLRGRYEHLEGYTINGVFRSHEHAELFRFIGNVTPATFGRCLANSNLGELSLVCVLNNLADAGLIDLVGGREDPTAQLTPKGKEAHRVL